MTTRDLATLMIAILIVGVAGLSGGSDAEALKAKNAPISGAGSSQICGLMLCSEYTGGRQTYETNWVEVFLDSQRIPADMHSDDQGPAITPFAHSADEDFPMHLDIFIHKFELAKISADEAIDGISEIHEAYVQAGITNEIIDSVGEKLGLYTRGMLDVDDAIESIHLSAEPQNVNPEYQGALDEVIHKFELDKISADEAIDGIREVHDGFVRLYITSDLIESVAEKIELIDSGVLSGAEAVESIHLSAEPQNVNPEYQGALDEVIHKFELDKISADEAIDGIIEVHDGFVRLYITSDLIESVAEKIELIDSGVLSGAEAVESIHLSAEPQNVNPEYQGALDEVIHKFELDKISADEAIDGIREVHDGFVDLYITSDLIESVAEKIELIDSGVLSGTEAVESIHLSAEPQNVNPEYQGALDEVIHKFELDKISAEEAIDGIREVHDGFVRLYITSDLIESVAEKIELIDSGVLSGAEAVESIHLSAEPQNVNPEFIGAVEEHLYQFELGNISAEDATTGIIDVHGNWMSIHISSDLIDAVGAQIDAYESGNGSTELTLQIIYEVIEDAEIAMAAIESPEVVQKDLPPNTVDMPKGGGVPGCETNNACYTPTHITVSAGTTITWINSDGSIPHTVTAGEPDSEDIGLDYPNGFDSDFMSGGASFEHTFGAPGHYDYHCLLHPWMTGTVTVE